MFKTIALVASLLLPAAAFAAEGSTQAPVQKSSAKSKTVSSKKAPKGVRETVHGQGRTPAQSSVKRPHSARVRSGSVKAPVVK